MAMKDPKESIGKAGKELARSPLFMSDEVKKALEEALTAARSADAAALHAR